ncbi:MAG: ABC transporter ATP-binding protein [Peptoniphilaceae bacterium]|nr:ABC transporter ATP-binding protein [Peptoniphilaceae bacterium]
MDAFIHVKDLYKIYRMGSEKVFALNGINLDIFRGEMLCLLGPSGSGKSTLLNSLAGLERVTKGEIVVGGVHLEKLNEAEITRFRSLNVGFVFQSYNLIPALSALENVTLGLTLKGVPLRERQQRAREVLELVGLADRMNHKPSQLSGGQQQRVSIARAFVGNPKIVFADEPTGNLDTKTSFEVMDLISRIAKEKNQTVIMVTHDEEMTVYADRMFHMRDGEIERIHDQKILQSAFSDVTQEEASAPNEYGRKKIENMEEQR